MVICNLEEKPGDEDYCKGVSALAAGILFEGTRSKDMVKKLDLYMSCGVREYWIVNPANREVTVCLFTGNEIDKAATRRKTETVERMSL